MSDNIMSSKGQTRNQMVVEILYASSWLRKRWNKILKPFNLSEQQFNVLRILRGQYPSPAMLSTVQERMLDQMSNASRLVDKLEKKNLVSRRRNEKNRRQVNILITKSGLDLLSELDEVLKIYVKDFDHISENEAQQLIHILDKIRAIE